MVPKLLKAETSRHTWLLFFLLIPYHKVLSFTWKCTLSLSFSHVSISCLCFCPSHHRMISPWPIVKRSEQVPFSIFYILVSDLLKIWITFISLPLLKSFSGFLLQSEYSVLGSARLCTGQSLWLPLGPHCSATISFWFIKHVKLTPAPGLLHSLIFPSELYFCQIFVRLAFHQLYFSSNITSFKCLS